MTTGDDMKRLEECAEEYAAELEQYREAVAPLRQADFDLVREVVGMTAEMSPTMGFIGQTTLNLLEIFDPHEELEVIASNITAIGETFLYYCKNCDETMGLRSNRKKRCPKCNWKRGFGLVDAD